MRASQSPRTLVVRVAFAAAISGVLALGAHAQPSTTIDWGADEHAAAPARVPRP
jgi:hypothetical protein